MALWGKPPLHLTLRLAHSAAARTRSAHASAAQAHQAPPSRQRRATAGAHLPRHGDDEHLGEKDLVFKLASLEKGEAATGSNREASLDILERRTATGSSSNREINKARSARRPRAGTVTYLEHEVTQF